MLLLTMYISSLIKIYLSAFLAVLLYTALPSPQPLPALAQPPDRRINAPQFVGDIPLAQSAVFWFGQVNSTANYADVRVGYNAEKLVINLEVFDRRLWYDETAPSPATLDDWDAVTLYLNLAGNTGSVPTGSSYRFVGQVNHWQPRANYQAAFRGDGSGWATASTPFVTATGWRGYINEDKNARGWVITFEIPFASLGLAGAPATADTWGMALALHDRDDQAGTPIASQTWPAAMTSTQPASWGQLGFGLPAYAPPAANPGGVTTIRHGLNGAIVPDAHVGGHTDCGAAAAPDYFSSWGGLNYAGYEQFNIQNQADVADWPCFSKYYVTFPLSNVPAGKSILSATLTLHQFGNADPSQAQPSLVQVSTVGSDWNEAGLTWNNAPPATENVAQSWVDPVSGTIIWPGWARQWDVSSAVAGAYATGTPLRLALYAADGDYHSGKYFTSSDVPDWDAAGRPTLWVLWGEPYLSASPLVKSIPFGGVATYTLQVQPIGGSTAPVSLTTPAPPPNISYQITPSVIPQPPGQAILTITDSHPPASNSLLLNIPVTAGNGIDSQTTSIQLLVGGHQVFLPVIIRAN